MPVPEIIAGIVGSQLITTCWQGAVGNYFHGGCEWLRKQVPAGTPQNHDVLKAMHRCFRETMQLMAKACADVDGANRDSRLARRKLGDYARSRVLSLLDLEHPDLPSEVLEEQVRTIYGQQGSDGRAAATDAVIAFVERQIGISLTPAIRTVFHSGCNGSEGWATTFELLFAAEIKQNDRVRSILLASRANELVALAGEEAVRIEALFDRLDGIEQTIERGFDEQRQRFDEIVALLKDQGGTGGQQLTTAAEAVVALSASPRPQDRAIADEVTTGDPAEAFAALIAEGESGKRRNAERFRQAARIIAPFSPQKARDAYEEAVALDPSNLWSWIELGRLRADYDSLERARACFGAALQRVEGERDRSVLHNEFGNVLMLEGQLVEARKEYESALNIAEQLAEREPGNSDWQRDLSVSHNKLGNVEVSSGNLGAARARFEASLAIRKQLAEQEPNNSERQRDLSISLNRLGDIEVASGNLGTARARFEAGLAIRRQLAERSPGNSERQRDLSISHDYLGDIEETSGNLTAARACFEAGLAIAEQLAEREPGNSEWQRDLSISHNKLGNIEVKSDNLWAARARFESSLAIIEQLAEREPGNSEWQRDLSITHQRLGDIEVRSGNLGAGRARFEESLVIAEQLAEREPSNSEWQRDLSVNHERLGIIEETSGNLVSARDRFEASLAIRKQLAEREPGNSLWQRDLTAAYDRLAKIAESEGDVERAIELLQLDESIMAILTSDHPDHPDFARDLVWVRRELNRLRSP